MTNVGAGQVLPGDGEVLPNCEQGAPNRTVAPGHYEGVDNDVYHAGSGVSKSHLSIIQKSAKKYFAKYLDPDRVPEEKTEALIMGGAIDAAILEPDTFTGLFVVRPEGIDGRTKDGKIELANFRASIGRRTELTAAQYKTCMGVRDAVHKDQRARGLIARGMKQSAFYAIDHETGELIKCKPDNLLPDGGVLDLKSAVDASPDGFGRAVVKYGYDMQAFWYPDVIEQTVGEPPPYFVFLAVEKEPPYDMGIYFADEDTMTRGRILARRALLKIVERKRLQEWPSYTTDPQPVKLPPWAMRDL